MKTFKNILFLSILSIFPGLYGSAADASSPMSTSSAGRPVNQYTMPNGTIVSVSSSNSGRACTPERQDDNSSNISNAQLSINEAQFAKKTIEAFEEYVISPSESNEKVVCDTLENLQKLHGLQNREGVYEELLECWNVILGNLKNVKDTPEKQNAKDKTVYKLCSIIIEVALKLKEKNNFDVRGQWKKANEFDGFISKLSLEEQQDFNNPAEALLPNWIFQKCFEYVETLSTCGVNIQDAISDGRQIRMDHILHGHSMCGQNIQNTNVKELDTSEIILQSPDKKIKSVVWKKLLQLDFDNKAKKNSENCVMFDQKVRKTIFSENWNAQQIEECIKRAVQTQGYDSKTGWKIFKDPACNMYIEVCYRTSGSWISTAYPIYVIDYATMSNFIHVFDKIGACNERITLRKIELESYIKLSTNNKVDCNDHYLIDIGNMEPLYSCLYKVSTNAEQSSSKKVKRGQRDSDAELFADSQIVTQSPAYYCPIYIKISKGDYEALRNVNNNAGGGAASALTKDAPSRRQREELGDNDDVNAASYGVVQNAQAASSSKKVAITPADRAAEQRRLAEERLKQFKEEERELCGSDYEDDDTNN